MTLTDALALTGTSRTAATRAALATTEPDELLTILDNLKAPARKTVLGCLDAIATWPTDALATLTTRVLVDAHDTRSTLWHALMPVVPTEALVLSLDRAREERSANQPLLDAELVHRMGQSTNQRLWDVRLEAAAALLEGASGDAALAAVVKQAIGRPRQARDALERVERSRRDVAVAARQAQVDAEQRWVDALTMGTLPSADVRPSRG
jgi:hypothetical protein